MPRQQRLLLAVIADLRLNFKARLIELDKHVAEDVLDAADIADFIERVLEIGRRGVELIDGSQRVRAECFKPVCQPLKRRTPSAIVVRPR